MGHLVRRFFGHITATPLNAQEMESVGQHLSDRQFALFVGMSIPDQRHSYKVWERLDHDAALAVPSLLHDVGKAAGITSAFARSVATVLIALRAPLSGRWAVYRDHGKIGAQALASVDAGDLAVAFAEFHPGPPPDGVDTSAWMRLADADNI